MNKWIHHLHHNERARLKEGFLSSKQMLWFKEIRKAEMFWEAEMFSNLVEGGLGIERKLLC